MILIHENLPAGIIANRIVERGLWIVDGVLLIWENRTMTPSDLIAQKREDILRIAAKYGVTELRLIGSVARGEARPDSDIDLLVKWPPETSLLDHAGLMLELEELLGRKVDIASDGWLNPGVRESVYREAVPL